MLLATISSPAGKIFQRPLGHLLAPWACPRVRARALKRVIWTLSTLMGLFRGHVRGQRSGAGGLKCHTSSWVLFSEICIPHSHSRSYSLYLLTFVLTERFIASRFKLSERFICWLVSGAPAPPGLCSQRSRSCVDLTGNVLRCWIHYCFLLFSK